jgi:competence protein CoiA
MIFATVGDQAHTEATPHARGTCPVCHNPVIARCGEINVWHWAHEASSTCDEWSEADTAWHYAWKNLVPAQRVEVLVEAGSKRHLAPLVSADGTFVELRSKYISPSDVRGIEAFYKDRQMVWLFDARQTMSDTGHGPRVDLRPKGDLHTFRWKHPMKHVGYTSCPRVLDLAETGVFRLDKLYLDGPPYGGFGLLWNRADFVRWLVGGNST